MIRPEVERPRAEQSEQAIEPGQVDAGPVPDQGMCNLHDCRKPVSKCFGAPTRFALGQFDVEDRTRWGIHDHPLDEH